MAEAQDRFISLWGRTGSNWGIPRTMAEVHALLFITGNPMSADDVMDRLKISRGNASMTLRALVDWGLVERTHNRGDRREYFQAVQDVWRMFRIIVRERKKREVDPVLEELAACRDMTASSTPSARRKVDAQSAELEAHNARLESMLTFFQLLETISERFISPSGEGLEKAAQLLARRVS